MNLSRERLVRLLREAVLTVGAVLGGLVLIVGVASLVFDVRPLVFRSGSMSPTIETGALAVAHQVDAADLAVGDIVSVHTSTGSRVTHRITLVEMDGDRALLRLKGDANAAEDAETYRVNGADVVLFSIPGVGYLLEWASGSTGRFVLGLYAAFLALVILQRGHGSAASSSAGKRRRRDEVADRRMEAAQDCRGRLRVGTAAGVVVVLTTTILLGTRLAPTWAAWTDSGAVNGTTLTTYNIPAPTGLSCVLSGSGNNRTATWSWTGVTSPATTYGTVLTGNLAPTSQGTGGTASAPTYFATFAINGAANRNKTGTLTITPTIGTWTGSAVTGTASVNNANVPSCAP